MVRDPLDFLVDDEPQAKDILKVLLQREDTMSTAQALEVLKHRGVRGKHLVTMFEKHAHGDVEQLVQMVLLYEKIAKDRKVLSEDLRRMDVFQRGIVALDIQKSGEMGIREVVGSEASPEKLDELLERAMIEANALGLNGKVLVDVEAETGDEMFVFRLLYTPGEDKK